MNIEIIVGFDGSCPRSQKAVKRIGERKFIIYPSHRRITNGLAEEKIGAGSRFCVRIVNHGKAPDKVELIVDWQTESRTSNHDIGHCRREQDTEWTMISGLKDGSKITYRVSVMPGLTHMALYPEYNTEQCEKWVNSLCGEGLKTIVAGRSRRGRKIWLLKLKSPNPRALPFFIQARDHAYETAGSYAVEGMVRFLLSREPQAEYLRSKFNFWIMPMTNPDGVALGMSRLTWEKGADINRVITVPDRAHDVLKRTIDKCRPQVHMNIHNWTNKFTDGMLCNDGVIAERILTHMSADTAHHKRWFIETSADNIKRCGKTHTPPASMSWKNYCRDKFSAWGCCFEFPWFGLNTEDMRIKGTQAMTALAYAAIETSNW